MLQGLHRHVRLFGAPELLAQPVEVDFADVVDVARFRAGPWLDQHGNGLIDHPLQMAQNSDDVGRIVFPLFEPFVDRFDGVVLVGVGAELIGRFPQIVRELVDVLQGCRSSTPVAAGRTAVWLVGLGQRKRSDAGRLLPEAIAQYLPLQCA